MLTIPIADILVTKDRHRKVFNKTTIAELAHDIALRGLMHPVVVVTSNAPKKFTLVAGERRLRAVEHLNASSRSFFCHGSPVESGRVPVTFIEDHGAIALREAELAENLKREDLTWQEEVRALSELHRLREAQAAAAGTTQSATDTARELSAATGKPTDTYRLELARAAIIADNLDDPAVAAARTKTEAYATATRRMERDFRRELAEDTLRSPHTFYESTFEAWCGAWGKDAPLFSCIIADPPYGINASKFGDVTAKDHQYEDDESVTFAEAILATGPAYTLNEAHLYLFCDIDHFVRLRDFAEVAGWQPIRTPLVWIKGTSGHAAGLYQGVQRGYELILCCRKGNKAFNEVRSDVIQIPNLRDKEHAAQKPPALYEDLLSRSCIAGDIVLDPCCGSGTIFEAATKLNLRATGIEPDATYASIARSCMEPNDDE